MAKGEIVVELPGGARIALNLDGWKWEAKEGENAELFARMANCVLHDYSAGDGEPGFRLAGVVAKTLGGKATLPELPPGDPEAIY